MIRRNRTMHATMNAAEGSSSRFENGGRARLKPGVPAGGVAALALIGGVLVYALVAGGGDDDRRSRIAVHVPHPVVDEQQIQRAIEMGLRDVQVDLDVEAIRQEAMAAAAEALAELDSQSAELAAARAAIEAARNSTAPADTGGGRLDAGFTAPGGVRLADIQGDIRVVTTAGDRVRLKVDERAENLRTVVSDGVLTVTGVARTSGMDMVLEIPESGRLTIGAFIGDLDLTGYRGELTADMKRGDIRAGDLAAARVKVEERADIRIGRVTGSLALEVAGRADASVGQVGSLVVESTGRTKAQVGKVDGGMVLTLPGRADLEVGEANGAVKVEFGGAGAVRIAEGRSEDMDVAVMGSGEFTFNGTAVDPVLYVSGAGSITVPDVEGVARVDRSGRGSLVVGN